MDCRICTRSCGVVFITKDVKILIEAIIGDELRNAAELSEMICYDCCSKFDNFWKFRQEVLRKQNKEIKRINEFYNEMRSVNEYIELHEIPNVKLIDVGEHKNSIESVKACEPSTSRAATFSSETFNNFTKSKPKAIAKNNVDKDILAFEVPDPSPSQIKVKVENVKGKRQQNLKADMERQSFEFVNIEDIMNGSQHMDCEDFEALFNEDSQAKAKTRSKSLSTKGSASGKPKNLKPEVLNVDDFIDLT